MSIGEDFQRKRSVLVFGSYEEEGLEQSVWLMVQLTKYSLQKREINIYPISKNKRTPFTKLIFQFSNVKFLIKLKLTKTTFILIN